ncbi:MAG: hypothetical protein HQ517_15370 [SAR324 cluster bacterium]|nr:hypothetical protein [SAR324 cluster bacterium]
MKENPLGCPTKIAVSFVSVDPEENILYVYGLLPKTFAGVVENEQPE